MSGPSRRVLRRVAVGAFFAVVAGLIAWQARRIEWASVLLALRSYEAGTLLLALALAAGGHLVYSTFDLIGRHYVGHRLPARDVMRVGFVSYAFNLNLGTLIGAVGMRVRLYSRLGLEKGDVARIVALSLVTNWSGYLALAGVAFALRVVDLPDDWRFGEGALQLLGFALLALVAGYLLLCKTAHRRTWRWREQEISLPALPVAALQIGLSMANWSVMAAIVWVLLRSQVADAPATNLAYGAVLATLLIGCMAGVLAKIPAGLGVLEAVFISMLGHRVGEPQLLAALLAYRAIYYLIPLAVAALTFGVLEAKARRTRTRSASPAARPAPDRRAHGPAAPRRSG